MNSGDGQTGKSERSSRSDVSFSWSDLALSTRWNARRHTDGAAMVDEILALGFSMIEIGYDLRRDLVSGLHRRIREGAVRVVSVHNYCPVPMGAPRGSPEIFLFSDLDRATRDRAVEHTIRTIRFAAECGAHVVVAHGGYVRHWRPLMPRLLEELQRDPESRAVQRLRSRIEWRRERRVRRHLDALRETVERLVPVLKESGVTLALENLPAWEAVPTEMEWKTMLEEFQGAPLGYWHDTGHGQIREHAGFINHQRLFERVLPYTVGMHIHDVRFPATDHLMPPGGTVDFSSFAEAAKLPIPKVIEPAPDTLAEALRSAADYLHQCWATSQECPQQ